MDDLSAAQALDQVTEGRLTSAPFLGFLTLGLLLGNYGTVGEVETHHWLGFPVDSYEGEALEVEGGLIPIYPSAAEGIEAFLLHLNRTLDLAIFERADAGELAWAMLAAGMVQAEPSYETWLTVSQGVEEAGARLSEALGAPPLWVMRDFVPPIETPEASPPSTALARVERAERMSHEAAEDALRQRLPDDVSSAERLAMLLWAYASSEYGFVRGVQTHNWALRRIRVQGEQAPPGYILDETGEVAIRVFASEQEGIDDFLEMMESCRSIDSEDIGALAEEMVERQAFGAEVKVTGENWAYLRQELIDAAKEISLETGLPIAGWSRDHIPKKVLEVAQSKKEEYTVPPEKPFPWPMAMGALGLAVIGYLVFSGKSVSSSKEPPKSEGNRQSDKKPSDEELTQENAA